MLTAARLRIVRSCAALLAGVVAASLFANPPVEAGYETVQVPPGSFGKIAPINGATNRPTTTMLTWMPSAGATGYEVCIDKTDNGACGSVWEAVGNTTSYTVKNLTSSTVHSWQVRAVNGAGMTYADYSSTAFTPFKTAPASRIPYVDFDGNGFGDVLVQELSTGQWSWQRFLPGALPSDGSFIVTSGNQGPDSTTTPVFNNDDALADGFRFNAVTGQWQRLISNGTSNNGSVQSGIWWQGWQRHVLNLDGDGVSDFFLYDPATGIWFQCLSLNSCNQGGWNPGWEVHTGRLNNDSFTDVFIIDRTTGRWFWALSNGAGGFTYPVTETWFPGWNIHPGDFNGDGLTDFLLHDPNTGGYFVASSTGSGFIYAQGVWSAAWKPIVVDLDGDGKDDVFRHDPAVGNWTQMISDGSGGFTKVATGRWTLGWQIHPTDFDGDGRADFLLYHPQTGAWVQLRNIGPGGAGSFDTGTWKPGLKITTVIGR